MTKPLIAITAAAGREDIGPYYRLGYAYAAAVEHAGGLPVILPYMVDHTLIPTYLDRVDGVLFTGGPDLDPARFGQERHPKAEPINPDREAFELALIAEVDRRRQPALCICLGCQVLNVHRGGSLHQFLPDLPRANALEHRKVNGVALRHDITLDPDAKLARRLGTTRINVNTFHKQAVDRPGRNLRIVAWSPDGIPEAIEATDNPQLWGVQWHPERLHDEPEHLAPFQMLVESAAKPAPTR